FFSSPVPPPALHSFPTRRSSDLANFAEELGKRSHQVAAAVHKTASGVHSQRATMPLIAQPENHSDENTDDDGFPSVETDVDSARSEEHTSELQSLAYLVCRLLLE